MNWKQVAAIVGLVALIVLAVYFGIIRRLDLRGPMPPGDILAQTIELIDTETGELVSLTMGEWEELPKRGLLYKNPNSGDYTLYPPITCAACGEKVVPPPEAILSVTASPADRAKADEAMANYICPKCGKPVLPAEVGGPPGPPPGRARE